MTSDEIRKSYIEFFLKRGHQEIPPAPLVPPEDPTTLFTSSGMQQLVPFLKGQEHPMGKRLVNAQPCFRAEDIDQVGDNRHTSFFEMLGNWSLGDYFKKEQLPWFFEFLTREVGLDPNRLFVTVFEGNAQIPRDVESITIWKEIFKTSKPARPGTQGFIKDTKIYAYGARENWWSRAGAPEHMPPGEIGGPDSEVFFDFGEERKIHERSSYQGSSCHLNCECGRFVEIGNSVFIEYTKQKEDTFQTLPQKNVDFGGGLERIAAAAQGKSDVFTTDLMTPIIEKLEEISARRYEGVSQPPMRVLSDHLKAAVFMAAEGVRPGNKLQGYVLRRLIRRCVVKILLDLEMPPQKSVEELTEKIFELYATSYLMTAKLHEIHQVLGEEVEKFLSTIHKGMKLIQSQEHIDGKLAFDLYQSYGFPFEITQEILGKRGLSVPKEDFEREYRKHQQLSRTASTGIFKGGLADKAQETVKLHTATHLLHQALREVLGDHVHQEGSHITAGRLRFDFSHPRVVTDDQLQKIESLVNEKIKENLPVYRTIERKEDALKSGALAFFKESYPENVSVYTIGKDPHKGWFSKELCAGPHVKSTGEIRGITISKQQSVGEGLRRLYATLLH